MERGASYRQQRTRFWLAGGYECVVLRAVSLCDDVTPFGRKCRGLHPQL
ncbi:MAG: hypothetical protein J6W23_13910 [Victivallales bacterium]|nr:hypothetical protein [Victivallales bacterium]